MKYILIFILVAVASCSTISGTTSSDPVDLRGLDDINPATGEFFTSNELAERQAKKEHASKDDSVMDRILSTPILILFAVCLVLCVIGVIVAVYMKNGSLAVACGVGVCCFALLPTLIMVFLKTMMFLMYVFMGIVLIGLIAAGIWIWKQSKDKHKANVSLVDNIQNIKESMSPERLELLRSELIDDQCDITRKEVDKIKKVKKGKK